MENNEARAFAWLKSRGISLEILVRANIHWDEASQTIVIPVYGQDGSFLFNKYRRAPWNDAGPKYKYDAGASSKLYSGFAFSGFEQSKQVFLNEGELDSLAMLTHGFYALSTTGGSNCFLKEWATMFDNKEVFIVYDTDDAGIKGAFKVQDLIPHAKIIWLPKGKDATEFFLLEEKPNTVFESLIQNAKTYTTPKQIDWNAPKRQINETIKTNEQVADLLLHQIDIAKAEKQIYRPLEMLLAEYLAKNEADRKRLHYISKKNPGGALNIAEAKKVPLVNFLEFSFSKTAKCLWHDDHSPSLYYYPAQNLVHCFSCDAHKDVIDIVQKLNGCSLQEAVEIILNKK